MNRRDFFNAVGGLTFSFSVATNTRGASAPPRIVATKDKTYRIGRVEPILTREIDYIAPASEGRYSLISQDLRPEPTQEIPQPFGQNKLWLFDARRRTTRLVLRLQDDAREGIYRGTNQIKWFPGAKLALIKNVNVSKIAIPDQGPNTDRSNITSQLQLFDPAQGTLRNLLTLAASDVDIRELPGLSGILLSSAPQQSPETKSFCIVQPDGKLTPVATIASDRGIPSIEALSADRSCLFALSVIYEKISDKESARKETWQEIEIKTGNVRLRSGPPKANEIYTSTDLLTASPLVLREEIATLTLQKGHTTFTNSLWLEARIPGPDKEQSCVLLAPRVDPSSTVLLSDLSAVLYIQDQALYAVSVTTER